MDTDRVEAFSDGVFAFAITVLLLAIAVPEAGAKLGPALLQMWPSYVAYLMSFVVIGAIWINHHGATKQPSVTRSHRTSGRQGSRQARG